MGRLELEIDHSVRKGRHTLALAGELDMATAGELEAWIAQVCANGAEQLVLDLRQLAFMDSTGLRAVLGARTECEQHGCSLVLTGVKEPVERLFKLTGADQKLPLGDNERRAS